MPRITPLRVVLLPVLCYITLVVLWVALPSIPSVHGGNNGHYYQDILQAGKVLTTTYRNTKIYNTPKNDDNREGDWFGIEWRLIRDIERNFITLRIGANTDVNLTNLASTASFYIADPVAVVAKSGVLDGVNMPWFEEADACLLSWEIERVPKIIEVRPVVGEQSVVQIWPEHTYWNSKPLEVPDYGSKLKPYLTISRIPLEGDRADLSQIQVDDGTWNVPTKTFAARRWILITLKPTVPVIAYLVRNLIIGPISVLLDFSGLLIIYALVYGAIVLGCWLAQGKPPFVSWVHGFVLTRWFLPKQQLAKKVIWGPGGLIEQIDDSGGLEEDIDVHLAGLGTITSPRAFFRSRAPLDELLNTFHTTRWMVRPLGQDHSHVRNRFQLDADSAMTITETDKLLPRELA